MNHPAGLDATLPVDDATRARNNLVISLLLVATFVVVLNETVMGVALPHLMEDLSITATSAQWLTTGFLLTMAVVIPITGFLLQRFHTRQLFVAAMALFSAGTALAIAAPGFEVLLAARVVQASGTAIMLPLLMTTVMSLEPPATRGRRMGSVSIVISVAPAIGPTISGLILTSLNWRYLFVFVLPVALAALALGFVRMANVTEPRPTPIDVGSVVLAAVGFGALVYGLSRIGDAVKGSDTTAMVTALVIGVVFVAIFVVRQLALQRQDRALLDLRTFLTPTFTASVVMFVVTMMALFGTLILLPIYMQNVLGFSVLKTGLMLLPGGLVMGLLGPVVGRWYDKVGPRPLLIPGIVLTSAVLWALTLVGDDTAAWRLLAGHVVLSVGLALVFTPLFTASLGSLPSHLYSHGSAAVSTLQQVAGAAGTALFVSIMASIAATREAGGATAREGTTAGVQGAFLLSAIVCTLGILVAFFIRSPAPAVAVEDRELAEAKV